MRKFEDPANQRVHFLDERFYLHENGNYYPSVTTILEVYPKGPQFAMWLKDVGHSAPIIAERAAESGTKVHNACEKLIAGEELTWDDHVYDFNEWNGILRFHDFATRFTPVWEASEVSTYSLEYKYAGTIDIVCKIGDERWLLDIKFGNAIYTTYFLQLAAYRYSWQETNPDYPIHKMGILHLKAATRTEGKGKTMQGVGWKIEEPKESYERLFEIFHQTLKIYYFENPDPRPKNLILPSSIRLEGIKP